MTLADAGYPPVQDPCTVCSCGPQGAHAGGAGLEAEGPLPQDPVSIHLEDQDMRTCALRAGCAASRGCSTDLRRDTGHPPSTPSLPGREDRSNPSSVSSCWDASGFASRLALDERRRDYLAQ